MFSTISVTRADGGAVSWDTTIVTMVNPDYVRELVPDFKGALVLVLNDRQRSRVEVSRRQARELRRRLGL